MFRSRIVLAASAFLATLSTHSHAALIIGSKTVLSGNNFPFGSGGNSVFWTPRFQQVYGASAFKQAINITSMAFLNVDPEGDTIPTQGDYLISLSTTNAVPDGLSSVFDSNVGTDEVAVFNGALPTFVAVSDWMEITFDNPFFYDPNQGNLLMDVFSTTTTQAFGRVQFASQGTSADEMSRAFRTGRDSTGLTTRFSFKPVNSSDITSIPVPATLTLIGLGVAGLGWRRRKAE